MANIVVTTVGGLAEILRVPTESVRSWLKEKNLTGASRINNILPIEVNEVQINPLLTPADVAAIFGVKESMIKEWCRSQKMECIVLNPKAKHHIYRFTKKMVERHINKCWRGVASVYNGWYKHKDNLFWRFVKPNKTDGELFADMYIKKYDEKLEIIVKEKTIEHAGQKAEDNHSGECEAKPHRSLNDFR